MISLIYKSKSNESDQWNARKKIVYLNFHWINFVYWYINVNELIWKPIELANMNGNRTFAYESIQRIQWNFILINWNMNTKPNWNLLNVGITEFALT